MHRHVRRVGDERAVRREHRAGEVEPLLDVDRIGGVLQRHPHLLGNRHEQVVEHFKHHRVGIGADGVAAGKRLDARRAADGSSPSLRLASRPRPRSSGAARSRSRGPRSCGRARASRAYGRRRRAIGRRNRTACAAPAAAVAAAVVSAAPARKISRRRPRPRPSTASTTSSLAASMKPKRARCAASNAPFIAAAQSPFRPDNPTVPCSPRSRRMCPAAEGRHFAARCRCRHSGYGHGHATAMSSCCDALAGAPRPRASAPSRVPSP